MEKGYESSFRSMLRRAGARRLERGMELLLARARETQAANGVSEAEALTQVYRKLLWGLRRKPRSMKHASFYCDAGLGGLARWLRAAGYEAFWKPDIDDHALLSETKALSSVLLTTDSMIMERKVICSGTTPALWLPPILGIPEQLQFVFREFGLTVRPPRCMSCGGELRRGDKQALRDRIPARTFRWLDEFFVCERCDKLFWHGTHWSRIRTELETASS